VTPEREREIERICQEALDCPRAERDVYLAEACRGDETLRREVERLLQYEDAAGGYLSAPAAVVAAGRVTATHVLQPGDRIGGYTIVSSIGAGGMGEVYRARDTALPREVAIKVLPRAATTDPDRLARFEREAHALASLNHHNIATIHGIERDAGFTALVLEFVDGETLAERLDRARLALADTLAIAKQIADALEAAHDKGIVHRDLKPANVKIRPNGVVKVLDFGLAKLTTPSDATAAVWQTPTLSGTGEGLVLGTATYMSPEQARGQPVDKRADIWAFGCVLYEMLTGRLAFSGATVSDTIAAILERDVDWTSLPSSTPSSIRRLLQRCVTKDPGRRLRDIGDARLELDESSTVEWTGRQASLWFRGAGWVGAAVILLTALVLGAAMLRRPSPEARSYRTEILVPQGFESVGSPGRFAISPDGRRLAFTARDEAGRLLLWIRSLDEASARPLAGTDGAEHPFWSPDSQMIAFYANRKLKKIAASGGATFTLCDAGVLAQGGTWNRDNMILFTFGAGPLFVVSSEGGTPKQVTTLNAKTGETGHAFPFFLPDGKHFLYTGYATRRVADRGPYVGGVYVGSLEAPGRTLLLDRITNAEYAQGHVLSTRDGALVAQALDATTMKVTGTPRVLSERVHISVQEAQLGSFSISADGAVVFELSPSSGGPPVRWVDRRGRGIGTIGNPGIYGNKVELSHDGTRLLIAQAKPDATLAMFVFDLLRNHERRLTSATEAEASAVWSPDGRRVAFARRTKGPNAIYITASDRLGSEELVIPDGFPESWSPDGRFLLYQTNGDLHVLPVSPRGRPFPLLTTRSIEWDAQFSPDGRWVAYTAFESGRYEIYVVPFSETNGGRSAAALSEKWRVSSGSGHAARWRRDGTEIFYWSPDTRKVMAVRVRADGSRFDVGAEERLFTARPRLESYPFTFYDVSADGQRFLVSGIDTQHRAPSLSLIVNWPALVKN
jgi:eukaryotic-like serine/threonine-protein kinase